MSDTKNKKHLGYEVLALALFLGGVFFTVSAVMSRGDGDGVPLNPTTEAISALLSWLGFVPFLGASLSSAALGVVMFLRPSAVPLRPPLVVVASMTVAASLLLGIFGAAGGSLGALLPGGIGGGLLAVLLSAGVALLGVWLAIGMPTLGKPRKAGDLNPVSAALKEEEVDGVSNAEAAALFPVDAPTPVAAPGVHEHELRSRGEMPDGVKPLEHSFGGQPEPQASVLPIGETDSALAVGSVEFEGARSGDSEGVKSRPVRDDLSDGVWVRDDEQVELGESPTAPSWESGAIEAELLEPTATPAEEQERFDELEVDVPLEPVETSGSDMPVSFEEDLIEDEEEEFGGELEEQEELEDEEVETCELEEEGSEESGELPDEDGLEELIELDAQEAESEAVAKFDDEECFDEEEGQETMDDGLGALGGIFEEPDIEGLDTEEPDTEEPAAVAAQQELFDSDDDGVSGSSDAELDQEPFTVEASEDALDGVELTPQAPKAEEQKCALDEESEGTEEAVALTREELVYQAGLLFIEDGRVAVSMLQRRFDLTFSTATEVLDELQAKGLIGPYLGGSRRDILMSLEEWEKDAAVRR